MPVPEKGKQRSDLEATYRAGVDGALEMCAILKMEHEEENVENIKGGEHNEE